MQLSDTVPPESLFNDYLYFSSFSETMLRHASAAVSRYLKAFQLDAESFVVEVASNDGYLLRNFVSAGVPCLGIEPAVNVAQSARTAGIETWTEYFGAALAQRLVSERGCADLILGNNVLAHAPDINDFAAGLKTLLHPGGRIVLELPYGVDLIENGEFDTIYHEHTFYFTLNPLIDLFTRHDLAVFDVERIPIHGGSLRLFIGHSGEHSIAYSTVILLEEELRKGIQHPGFYRCFADGVSRTALRLRSELGTLKEAGCRIAAYGASAKGSTLLNYCGVGRETVDFVVDRNPHKHGLFMPGCLIPVEPCEALLSAQPDYCLLLTWNFAGEILDQQSEYRQRGGRFIVPIPTFSVV
jgi:SAM-dependent methyltransferase